MVAVWVYHFHNTSTRSTHSYVRAEVIDSVVKIATGCCHCCDWVLQQSWLGVATVTTGCCNGCDWVLQWSRLGVAQVATGWRDNCRARFQSEI